jgi:hypothetical protein
MAAVFGLAVPASSSAAGPAPMLAPGAGYGSPAGSKAVRELQLRLRALGESPGPIDGLYGPFTAGAVERFQRAHDLVVDGVVGPQTRAHLVLRRTSSPKRKSPARHERAESAPQTAPPHDRQAPTTEPDSSKGVWPAYAALIAALGAGLLAAVAVWRLRARRRTDRARTGLSFGMVCAALLAVFAIGAVSGAIFATHATPDGKRNVVERNR